VLDVVKPRTDEGDKYIVKFSYNAPIGSPGPKAASIEDEQTGDLYFLAGIRNKKIMSKDFDPNEEHTDLHLLKFNKDLDLVGDLPIQFEYPQEVVYVRAVSASIDGKDEQDVGGGVIIFAPANLRGNKDFKRDPEINNFTFVHFDDECNLVSRVSFKPEIVGWNIDEAVVNKSEDEYEFYVYGPAALGKDDYWLKTYQKGKYKAVQVMKIKGGEVAYLTQTELPEFEAKMETPPAQKSGEVYEGKKFSRSGFAVSSNGDYYIMGQNIAKSDGPIYGNALCFHFNDEGKLKAQYSVEPHEKPKYSYKIDQAMKEINEDMFWIWIESAEENLFFPTIGKVKIDEGKVQNFLRMGMDEKGKKQEYFLNPKFPYLNIEDNQTVFFGNDEKGKNIWFCRVKFE
jgi:hypothetical protein